MMKKISKEEANEELKKDMELRKTCLKMKIN